MLPARLRRRQMADNTVCRYYDPPPANRSRRRIRVRRSSKKWIPSTNALTKTGTIAVTSNFKLVEPSKSGFRFFFHDTQMGRRRPSCNGSTHAIQETQITPLEMWAAITGSTHYFYEIPVTPGSEETSSSGSTKIFQETDEDIVKNIPRGTEPVNKIEDIDESSWDLPWNLPGNMERMMRSLSPLEKPVEIVPFSGFIANACLRMLSLQPISV